MRSAIAEALRRAFAGRLKWLAASIHAAGFRRPDDWYVPAIIDVAVFLGVNRKTFERWLKLGCPGKGDRGYDLRAIVRWRIVQGGAPGAKSPGARAPGRLAAHPAGGNGDGDSEDPVSGDARTRLYHWKAKRERLAYERARGDLIPRAEHERQLLLRSGYFVRALETLPILVSSKRGKLRTVAAVLREIKRLCDLIVERAYGVEEEGTEARRHEGTK